MVRPEIDPFVQRSRADLVAIDLGGRLASPRGKNRREEETARGRQVSLTLLAGAVSLAQLVTSGCLSSKLYDVCRSHEGGIATLPRSSDALSAPSHPAQEGDVAYLHMEWNWPAFLLALPLTIAWDAVTFPVQVAIGSEPYGSL